MKILVTGCCGFIGSHTTEKLLKNNNDVYGIDNMNNYYDSKIKYNNLNILKEYSNFKFKQDDICTTNIISEFKPDVIVHLASMAGVRYSIENPKEYIRVNIEGFIHILEECKKNNINKIIYASSSSVYGLNEKVPFCENDNIKLCNSPYACSKLSMEIFAKTYFQLFGINSIGLRFFTVYGPRGRPDMAPYKFLNAIINNKEITKYGNGESYRDYTYIDDIVNGIIGSINNIDRIKFNIYNLGNSDPVTLNDFINMCSKVVGKTPIIKILENQKGDVPYTYANIEKAKIDLNYNPQIKLEVGLRMMYESMV
jgi:UDP-glucuronate 4-epimerase